MFTGSPTNGFVATSVGYIVVSNPEKRSLVLTFQNPETLAWDMIGVGALTDPLISAVSAHLNGASPLSLVAILNTQLTWQARKTASKGCIATPASRLQVNASHPIFAPSCSLAEDVQFLHYFRVEVPSRMVFKDAPTGKYVTFYGKGFSALNAWASDIMPEATIIAASGMSAILTCIAFQRAGLLLRTTSGSTLITDPVSRLPHGLIVGTINAVATVATGALAGFEDFFMAPSDHAPLPCTPPRPQQFAAAALHPTPPSAHITPHKSGDWSNAQPTRVTPTVLMFMMRPPPVTVKIAHVCAVENLGLTCFIGVSLQLLSACDSFRRHACHCATAYVTNVLTLVDQVFKIVYRMYSTTQRCISPSELVKQTGLVGQHDAREFMEMLLNHMNDHFVTQLFQVETTCQVHCMDCGHVSARQDVTKMINVPLGNGNLQELLDLSFRGETMTGTNKYMCFKCGVKTDARAFVTITNAPDTVFIVLMRYTNQQTKIMTNVMAPAILHLPNNRDVAYNLKGIIAHCGNNPQSGHYVASHVTRDGVWHTFDDSTVYAGSLDVLNDPNISPYIFMYSRTALLDNDEDEDRRAKYISPEATQAAATTPVESCIATLKETVAHGLSELARPLSTASCMIATATNNNAQHERPEDELLATKKQKCDLPQQTFEPKVWADIVKDHDVECLQDKSIMVTLKGMEGATRVTFMGGGLSQVRVTTSDGAIRRVMWSALIGFATD